VSLPIKKSTTKNCITPKSEIGNDGGLISGFTFFLLGVYS
jgi:hypothetical protein